MSFDRIAPFYRALETIAFGNTLQHARVHWIDKAPRPTRALIIGEGNGRFLCELVRVHPDIDIDCVDASGRMLQLARRQVLKTFPESLKRVRFLQEDILTWLPSDSYDLLVTHFFLDCFQRDLVKIIVDRIGRTALPDAVWLLADFTIPAGGTLARMHAKLWLRAMYSFFRISAGITAAQLVDPAPYLREQRFVRTASRLFRAGLVKSDLYRRDAQS